MIDFRHLSLPQALGWPTTIVLFIGALTVVAAVAGSIGFALLWLVSHLACV